jgi:CheY-like chemotaxis protein
MEAKPMKQILTPSIRVAIVDASPQDYCALLADAGRPGVSIHFLIDGNDTLRFAKRCHCGLWVINRQLPDMSGFDLAQMLRSVRPSALIFLIAEQYNLDDELQTLTLGLAKYLCKPLEPAWILPDSEDFCIPLPTSRSVPPIFRVVSSPASDIIMDMPESVSLPEAAEKWGGGQVVLPFNPDFRRKPAA